MLFVDNCSKFMFSYNHVSLGAGETLTAKHAFESTLWSFGFSVLNFHGHNGIFAAWAFKDDCHVKQQKITLVVLVLTI